MRRSLAISLALAVTVSIVGAMSSGPAVSRAASACAIPPSGAARYVAIPPMAIPDATLTHRPYSGLYPFTLRSLRVRYEEPLTIVFVGSDARIARALQAIGWQPADPPTIGNFKKYVQAYWNSTRYPTAPFSPQLLHLHGDPVATVRVAYEREIDAVARPADCREHIRVWHYTLNFVTGASLGVASASLDTKVVLRDSFPQVIHAIAPDLNAERDAIVARLESAGQVAWAYKRPSLDSVAATKTAEGSPFVWDHQVAVVKLR